MSTTCLPGGAGATGASVSGRGVAEADSWASSLPVAAEEEEGVGCWLLLPLWLLLLLWLLCDAGLLVPLVVVQKVDMAGMEGVLILRKAWTMPRVTEGERERRGVSQGDWRPVRGGLVCGGGPGRRP